jgi:predicted small secreted protein
MNARVLVSRLVLVAVALAVFVLPACNTMAGAGRDIRCMGKNMECAAKKNDGCK